MSNFVLRRAVRKRAKLKLAISAPSGAGKTYSALLLAKGLVGDWDKIAVIDTENDSASLYSNLGPYNTINLTPPFSPERFIEAIEICEKDGMEVIIIDSMSAEWEGESGALELQTQLGGKYQDWAKVTPRHRAFVNAMLHSPCHIIGTMRRKTDYSMSEGSSGKKIVTKLGLKEVQRDGMEYEFTLHFALEQNHLAKVEKDRTGLFDGKPEFKITEETGKALRDWVDSPGEPVELYQATDLQKGVFAKHAMEYNISNKFELKELSEHCLGVPTTGLKAAIADYLRQTGIIQ